MKNVSFFYTMIFTSTFFLDRIAKGIVLTYFPTTYTVNKFLSIELVFNRGISWGIFHSTSDMLFWFISAIIISITMSLIFIAWNHVQAGKAIVGEVLILAGSLSNIIDRIMYNGVIDFIYFSYNDWSLPIFNVADVGIVIGLGIMILEHYKKI